MWKKNLQLALQDLWQGIAMVRVWSLLGWQEVRQNYRRSILGPFWLTISTGTMIAGVGLLYGRLLNQDLSAYFPYLAISLVLWMLLASLTSDACQVFITSESYIRNLKLPLTVHVVRVIWRNMIISAHIFIIAAIFYVALAPPLSWHLIELPIGIALIAFNAVWLSLLLGMVSARFRDIPQIVGSLVQMAFFLTPVFWKADMLGPNIWVAEYNPYFHFLEVVRQPLLGASASMQSWIFVAGVSLAGSTLTLFFFARFRARVAYWV